MIKDIFQRVIGIHVAAFAGVASLLGNPCVSEAVPVKIGVFIQDTTSDVAARKAFVEGAQLAVEKLASTTLTIQSFPAAQGLTPDSAQLKTLVETERAPLVMYWSVDDVSAVAPYLNQANALGLVGFEVRKSIPRLGSYIFGFGYTAEGSFSNFAKFAGKKLKAYRFGLISSSEPRFDTQSKAFSEETKSLGNTVVFDEKVSGDPAGFSALVSRAMKEKCDSIFATVPAASVSAFLKAVRTANFKGNVLIGDSMTAEELAAAGKDAEGIYMVQAWSDDATFRTAYTAKFAGSPDNVTLGFAALGYDAISCIAATPAPIDSSSIKYGFLSTPCDGLTGTTTFTGERIAQRKKRILTVRGGQFVLAE